MRRRIAGDAEALGDSASTHWVPHRGIRALQLGEPDPTVGVVRPTLLPLYTLLTSVSVDEDGSGGAAAAPQGAPDAAARDDVTARASGPSGQRVVTTTPAVHWPRGMQAAATDAIEAGLPLFFPTVAARRRLMQSLVAQGASLIVQFRAHADGEPAAAGAAEGRGVEVGLEDDSDSVAADALSTFVPHSSSSSKAPISVPVPLPALLGFSAPPRASARSSAAPLQPSGVAPPGVVRDLRYERALLLLQLEASDRGWGAAVVK